VLRHPGVCARRLPPLPTPPPRQHPPPAQRRGRIRDVIGRDRHERERWPRDQAREASSRPGGAGASSGGPRAAAGHGAPRAPSGTQASWTTCWRATATPRPPWGPAGSGGSSTLSRPPPTTQVPCRLRPYFSRGNVAWVLSDSIVSNHYSFEMLIICCCFSWGVFSPIFLCSCVRGL